MAGTSLQFWWLKQVGFFRESLFFFAMLSSLLMVVGVYSIDAYENASQISNVQELAADEDGVATKGKHTVSDTAYHMYFPLIGLFFPLVATTYVFARVRVRQLEILDAFRESNLFKLYVKQEGGAEDKAEIKFYKFLSQRVSERTSLFEYWLFSLSCFLIVFVGGHFLLTTYGFSAAHDPVIPKSLGSVDYQLYMGAAAGGFLGALSGSMVVVLRRYWNFDLQPTVFLQVMVVLVAVTLVCALLSSLYSGEIMAVTTLTIGFVSAINVEFLSRLMRRTFARLTKVQLPAPITSNLDKVVRNQEAIESLNAGSIYSLEELANADPIRLYLAMPQQISVINALIDQALLYYYFPEKVEQIRSHGVVRFSQLLGIFHIWPYDDEKTKTTDITLLGNENGGDQELAESLAVIVKSGIHHRVLSILFDDYGKSING